MVSGHRLTFSSLAVSVSDETPAPQFKESPDIYISMQMKLASGTEKRAAPKRSPFSFREQME